MIEQAIYDLLDDDAGLEALVGDRIYPVKPEQDVALPCVWYTLLTSDPYLTLNGVSSLTRSEFLVDCLAESYAEVKSIMAEVKEALHGHSQGTIQGIFISNSVDEEEEDVFHGQQTFVVHHQ